MIQIKRCPCGVLENISKIFHFYLTNHFCIHHDCKACRYASNGFIYELEEYLRGYNAGRGNHE